MRKPSAEFATAAANPTALQTRLRSERKKLRLLLPLSLANLVMAIRRFRVTRKES
jgi:hypothetical protein